MRRFLCRQATHPAAEKCLSALKRAVAEKQVTWLPCEAIMTGDGWNSTKNGNGMGMVYHWVYHVLVTWLVGYSPKWSNMISKPKNEPDKLYIVLPSGVVYKAWQFNIDRLIGCFFWCLYIPKYTHVMSAGGQVTHACVNHEMNAGECVYHVWQDMFHRQWLNMDGCTKDCSLNIIPSLTSIEHNSAPKMAGWTSKMTKHSSSEVLKFQHQGLPTSPICRACRGCALPHQPGWFIPSRESPNMAGTSTEIHWFRMIFPFGSQKISISFHFFKKIWISAWSFLGDQHFPSWALFDTGNPWESPSPVALSGGSGRSLSALRCHGSGGTGQIRPGRGHRGAEMGEFPWWWTFFLYGYGSIPIDTF